MIPTSVLPVEDTFIGALGTNILLLKVHGLHVATKSFLGREPFIANTAYQTQVAVFILVNKQWERWIIFLITPHFPATATFHHGLEWVLPLPLSPSVWNICNQLSGLLLAEYFQLNVTTQCKDTPAWVQKSFHITVYIGVAPWGKCISQFSRSPFWSKEYETSIPNEEVSPLEFLCLTFQYGKYEL